MKSVVILILLFVVTLSFFLHNSYAQSNLDELSIEITPDGKAKVTENIKTRTILSNIQIQLLTDKISNILATDENNILLKTKQTDNILKIDTLGASRVTLRYTANIVTQSSGVWMISYDSPLKSKIVLPSFSTITPTTSIPLDVDDDVIIMPSGKVSLSYTIKPVTENTFSLTSIGQPNIIKIITASKISQFQQTYDGMTMELDDNAPMLIIIPKSTFSKPYQITLNSSPIDFKQYYANATHNWIRIQPSESGLLILSEKSAVTPTDVTTEQKRGGGCLIATATYGSELSPQVQQLRELRDDHLLQTDSGSSFMTRFNQFYYSFSPTVADWERENPIFKEFVKISLTPMISSLSILNYVDMDSESSVLGYGISLILLNVGMYFVAPVIVIVGIRKKF